MRSTSLFIKSYNSTNLIRTRRPFIIFISLLFLAMGLLFVDLVESNSNIASVHANQQRQLTRRLHKKAAKMRSLYNVDLHSSRPQSAAVSNSNYQHFYQQPRSRHAARQTDDAQFDRPGSVAHDMDVHSSAPDSSAADAANLNKLEISVRVNGHPAPDVSVYKLPAEWLVNNNQQQPAPSPTPPPPPPPPPPTMAAPEHPPTRFTDAPATSPPRAAEPPTTTSTQAPPPPPPPSPPVTTVTTTVATEEPETSPPETTTTPPPSTSKHPSPQLAPATGDLVAEQQIQLVAQQQQQQHAIEEQGEQLHAIQQQLAQLQKQVSSPGAAPAAGPPPPPQNAVISSTTAAPSMTAATSLTTSTSSTQYNVLLSSSGSAADKELERLLQEPDECSGAPTQFSDALDDSRFFSPDSVQTEETPADAKWASEKAFLFALPENTKLKDEDSSHYFQILFPQPHKLYGWRVRGFAGSAEGDDGGLAAYQAQVFDSSSKRWVHILDDAGEARIFSAMPTFKANSAGELANEIYPVELSVPITDVSGVKIYPMQWVHKPYFKISINGCPLTVVSSASGETTIAPVAATSGPKNSKRIVVHRQPPLRTRAAAFEVDEEQLQSNNDGEEELGTDGDQGRNIQDTKPKEGISPLSQPPRPSSPDLSPIEPPKIELHFPQHHRQQHRRKFTTEEDLPRRNHLIRNINDQRANNRFDAHDDTAPPPPPPSSPSLTMTVNSNNNILPAKITCEARLLHMSDGLAFYRIDHGQQVRNLHSTPDLSSSSKRGWIVMRLLATPPSADLQDADENKLFGLEMRFTKGAYIEKLIIASAVREPDLSSTVTAFTVQYLKLNDDEWQWVRDPADTHNIRVFELPVDSDAVPQQLLHSNHTLDFSFRAKMGALRIFPQRWYRFPGFRVGLLGCVDA